MIFMYALPILDTLQKKCWLAHWYQKTKGLKYPSKIALVCIMNMGKWWYNQQCHGIWSSWLRSITNYIMIYGSLWWSIPQNGYWKIGKLISWSNGFGSDWKWCHRLLVFLTARVTKKCGTYGPTRLVILEPSISRDLLRQVNDKTILSQARLGNVQQFQLPYDI